MDRSHDAPAPGLRLDAVERTRTLLESESSPGFREKLAEREGLLGRFAPVTGFAARSRRTLLIIYLGFESRLWGAAIGMAEREEATALCRLLVSIGFFRTLNIRTINFGPK